MARDVRDEQTEAFKLAVEQLDPVATVVFALMIFALAYARWVSGKRRSTFLLWRDLGLGDPPLPEWFVSADGYRLDIWSIDRNAKATLHVWNAGGYNDAAPVTLVDGHLPDGACDLPAHVVAKLNRALDVAWLSPPCPDCGTEAPHDCGGHMHRFFDGRPDVPVTTCRNHDCYLTPGRAARKSATVITPRAS